MENLFPLPGPNAPGETTTTTTTTTTEASPLPTPEEASPPPPSYVAPDSKKAPVVKPSPLKIILPILGAVLVIGLIAFGVSKLLGSRSTSKPATPGQAITLTYYGLWEPSSVMKPVIDEFEKQNPGIKISYQLQSPQDYQDRVKTAIEGQNSPMS